MISQLVERYRLGYFGPTNSKADWPRSKAKIETRTSMRGQNKPGQRPLLSFGRWRDLLRSFASRLRPTRSC